MEEEEGSDYFLMSYTVASIVVIFAVFSNKLLMHVQACSLGYGPGNPYPWLIRIWKKQTSPGKSDPGRHVGMGALVTDSKVVSLCSIIPLKTDSINLMAYEYNKDGTYKCAQTTYFFLLDRHKKCLDGQQPPPEFDWAVWKLPFKFKLDGQPYLFPFRPTNQEFQDAQTRVTPSKHCEFPVFAENTEKSGVRSSEHIRFYHLEQCKKVYCRNNGPSCSLGSSPLENVNCAFIVHSSSERLWVYQEPSPRGSVSQEKDRARGAVMLCDGFPMGMAGATLKPGPDTTKDFRLLSSFINVIDMINPPPRPIGLSTTARTTTTRKQTTERTTTTTTTTTEPERTNYTATFRVTRIRRNRTTLSARKIDEILITRNKHIWSAQTGRCHGSPTVTSVAVCMSFIKSFLLCRSSIF